MMGNLSEEEIISARDRKLAERKARIQIDDMELVRMAAKVMGRFS